MFRPKTTYTKPKSTSGGEYREKLSGKDYRGFYIKNNREQYFAGKSPEDNGVELEKIEKGSTLLQQLAPVGMSLLMMIFTKLFKPTPTSGQSKSGTLPRYFVQDKTNNKIAETDKQSYQEAQLIPTVRTAQTDWIIAGPAEDKNFNGYPFEGAASKNKKTIQALEPQMPGISTFITDYSFLVEDPTANLQPVLSSTTEVVKDPLVDLENSRKANFDLRK
jgi:hypothetical protein